MARKTIPILLALLCPLLIGGCEAFSVLFTPPQAPVNMIYDDDCDGDVDCMLTQPIIHHWIDIGYIKMWGMVSSARSQLGAPTMKVFQHYYGHDNLFSIGAWTPGCALQPSAPWYVAVVGKFDAGDVCTNYVSCGTALRQSVANYIGAGGKANGLTYVITGPLSCEEEFRTTSADSISPLSGAQMEQQFIKEFVLMNGCAKSTLGYPCALETNCLQNTAACSAFFANVTSQNGYPPVFVVPLNTGAGDVHIQVPLASLPLTNPTACAFNVAGRSEAADEDAVALEYAVFGSIGWTVSADSTNIVNAATSANSWSSSTASGQYYLSVATSPTSFENIIASPWLPE